MHIPTRHLQIAQIITAIVAIIALAVAVTADATAAGNRHAAALDSCRLLRGLVYAATTHAPEQRAAAAAYVARTPLHDCHLYASKQ